jgi:hypothetical protein
MDRNEFSKKLGTYLKTNGFKKKGNYWFKLSLGSVFCVNLQSSQWDKTDYYVNIGFTEEVSRLTIGHWFAQHRCQGEDGNSLNISFECFLSDYNKITQSILSYESVLTFLEQNSISTYRNGKAYFF